MLEVLESAFVFFFFPFHFPIFFLEQINKGGHYLLIFFFLLGSGYLINGKLDKGFLLVDVI